MKSTNFDILIKGYSDLLENLLSSNHLSFDDENLPIMLPKQGGVYCISDKTVNIMIYIGQSKDLQNRIYRNHLIGPRRSSTLRRKVILYETPLTEDDVENYLRKQCTVQFVPIDDKSERNSFEHFAIAILKPKFND